MRRDDHPGSTPPLVGALLVVLSLVTGPGCLGQPGDKARVAATTTSPVHFSGALASPDTGLMLETEVYTNDGVWAQFATATSVGAGASIDVAGATMYTWGTSPDPVIPSFAWRPGLVGFEARVRAREAGSLAPLVGLREDSGACWTATGQSVPAFLDQCVAYQSPMIRVRTQDYVAFHAKGDYRCEYGDPTCNPCISGIQSAFRNRLGTRRQDRGVLLVPHMRKQKLPPMDVEPSYGGRVNHMQSVVRLSGVDGENWLAFTHDSSDANKAGLYFVQFAFGSSGEALSAERGDASRSASTVLYYRLPGPSHAGGMAALGRMLFISMDCASASACGAGTTSVRVYDASVPAAIDVDHPVTEILLDGHQGEIAQDATPPGGRNSSVAAARLIDGRFLVLVAGDKSGNRYGWIYVSRDERLDSSTVWDLVSTVCPSRQHDDPSCLANDTGYDYFHPWYEAQNMALVTECDQGRLHLVRLQQSGSPASDGSGVVLYRLAEFPTTNIVGSYIYNLQFIDGTFTVERALNTRGHGMMSLRYGGGLHITPSGLPVTYATERYPNGVRSPFTVFEYRPR